ncbi:hypothetical protein H0H93_014022 [Arthromyces matolae]|nr:hypothetical protein H0H93_014022 [Arthromyces matolae]
MSSSDCDYLGSSPLQGPASPPHTSSPTTLIQGASSEGGNADVSDIEDLPPAPGHGEMQQQQIIQRKRPLSEDWTQYAAQLCRRVRLKTAHEEELREFSKMPGAQQSIYLAWLVFQLREVLDRLQPVDAPYQIRPSLQVKIEKYAFVVFINPTLASYVDNETIGPVTALMEHLRRFPNWGLTDEVFNDPSKLSVIVSKAREDFITIRNQIEKSVGKAGAEANQPRLGAQDIVSTCKNILALRSRLAPNLKVSLKMAARVAFLRNEYLKNPDRKYWYRVDKKLNEIRRLKDDDPKRISVVFAKILQADTKQFPGANLENIVEDPLSMEQIESEATL